MLKLDIFPHIFPQAFFERMKTIAEKNPALGSQLKRWLHIPVLWDLDKRIKMMKRFPEYKQILTLSLPAIEFLGTPEETPALAGEVIDRMGAGDAFLAFTAPFVTNQLPPALVGFLGNAAGALAVKTVGNRDSVSPVAFKKFVTTLLR